MRARIIALIVLVILIGIPLGGYWFFMIRQESSLTIQSRSLEDFSVHMRGSLDYGFLPLADKFLEFHQECHEVCILSPLPPVKYQIILSSTGNISSVLEVEILAWETQSIIYESLPDIISTPIQNTVSEVTKDLPSELTFLSKVWSSSLAIQRTQDNISLGFYANGKYRLVRELYGNIKNISMDTSDQYIVIEQNSTITLISKDFQNEIEFPLLYWLPTIVSQYHSTWKVRTESWIYEYQAWNWIKNIRFTDYIDITAYQRIGYIAGEDTERLSLSNFSDWNGVMIALDRKTGKSYTLRNSIQIRGFYYEWETPAYIDAEGNRYTIAYKQ